MESKMKPRYTPPAEPAYPLGVPTNRPAPKGPAAVPGRPNWWTPPGGGEPYYKEPPAPQWVYA
jgi:hypothetical protein